MSLSNSLGLLGRKVGMMRLFTDDGDAVPVTVVDVSDNRVTQVKTEENDGYVALQVTFGSRKASRVTKPQSGHLAKAGVEAGEIIQEFRVTPETAAKYTAGAVVAVADLFSVGQKVDVQGTSIGKGFAGTIKRHNFASQRASHGNSRSHNVPGSISMAQDPGRVFPGKKMSGHLGDVTVTTQNLEVIRIEEKFAAAGKDKSMQLLLIKGATPGAKGGFLTVRPAVKAKAKGAQ
ncbi:50S ribosomal protein L3 [Ramlibacter rhizophilus]|uniref:Large ribosomal subunit protein uL3 n=1 Tax=Ramlibacter rhizophilus TaxID=1781167 RepID=A0A4Z0BE81_9BURK|nr:50S ribosomal protein L3 [Ramlibacter rhizophilus]TFY96198.1 50S ribosomal protein L3 [Ramlibacter rhizophilus]